MQAAKGGVLSLCLQQKLQMAVARHVAEIFTPSQFFQNADAPFDFPLVKSRYGRPRNVRDGLDRFAFDLALNVQKVAGLAQSVAGQFLKRLLDH